MVASQLLGPHMRLSTSHLHPATGIIAPCILKLSGYLTCPKYYYTGQKKILSACFGEVVWLPTRRIYGPKSDFPMPSWHFLTAINPFLRPPPPPPHPSHQEIEGSFPSTLPPYCLSLFPLYPCHLSFVYQRDTFNLWKPPCHTFLGCSHCPLCLHIT